MIADQQELNLRYYLLDVYKTVGGCVFALVQLPVCVESARGDYRSIYLLARLIQVSNKLNFLLC